MKVICLLFCALLPVAAQAQSRDFTLSVAPQVAQSGLIDHLVPRFALKHGVRVTLVDANGDAVIGDEGTPVFEGQGRTWHIATNDAAGPVLFADWLVSDVGKRTIAGFQPDGVPIFSAQIATAAPVFDVPLDGDAVQGEALALHHCGRCHVVNDTNRMKGMGQTPSFALMRTFDDWQRRFAKFYDLNPHPSFTQVTGVTAPFDADRPPAIVPVDITSDQIDAILAYVETIAPADLGAPLQGQ